MSEEITKYERVILKGVFETYSRYFKTVEKCFLAFNKSFDDTIRHLEYSAMLNVDPAEPIRLTEELLRRFGWSKLRVSGYVINEAVYWRKDRITNYEVRGKYNLPVGEKLQDQFGRTVIEFDKLHELEAVFALTGKKMKFKI